jgi:hypothetical protein
MAKQDDFVIQTIKKADADSCPFLMNFFMEKSNEFGKVPKKPDREGVPKGDKFPLPRQKLFLGLFKMMDPKVRLIQFAEFANVSAGVVRNWNREEAFLEKEVELAEEFSDRYVKRFFKLEELQSGDLLKSLIQEIKEYKNPGVFGLIYKKMSEKYLGSALEPISGSGPIKVISSHFRSSFLEFQLAAEENPLIAGGNGPNKKKQADAIKDYYKHQKGFVKLQYDILVDHIKNARQEDAMMLAGLLAEGAENLLTMSENRKLDSMKPKKRKEIVKQFSPDEVKPYLDGRLK